MSSDLHSVKKAAEQDAFAKLLERLLEQPARAGFAAPGTLDVAPVQVRAIEGDAVLKLILIRHFREQNPGKQGSVPTFSRSVPAVPDQREALFETYASPCRRGHVQWGYPARARPASARLLPAPTGRANLDATVEAWVADRFEYNSECLVMTEPDVLKALGLDRVACSGARVAWREIAFNCLYGLSLPLPRAGTEHLCLVRRPAHPVHASLQRRCRSRCHLRRPQRRDGVVVIRGFEWLFYNF